MKLLKTWQFLCLMLSILSLTSCSKSEDLDESDKWICILPPDDGTPLFTLDADSLPHFKNFKPISQSQFQKDIAGYGWNCNALQTIYNDGRFSNDNLIGSMLGLGPDHYYITKEKITKFFYVDALGYQNAGRFYQDRDYTYDETTGWIMSEGQQLFQLYSYLEADGRYFIYAIYPFGQNTHGTPQYCIATFQRMTSKQLEDIRKAYTVNYDEIKK